jgi:PAS domain S-box-containing protein
VGLPGRVWSAARPCWLEDATVDPSFLRADEANHAGLHAAVAFPVHALGELLGVIEFFGATVAPPDEPLLATMTTVGALIGQQIHLARSRDALRESEALRAAIVEGAEDAILSTGLDRRITSWNPAAERMLGWSAAEVVGRPATLLLPPERAEEAERAAAAVQRGERVTGLETVALRKDGARLDVCLSVSPLRGPGEAILGAAIIARDITERKRAEAALRESEARWRSLAKASTGVVWRVDAEGKAFEPSPSWDAYTGQRGLESVGHGWLDPVHPEDRPRIAGMWASLRATPRVFEEELRVWNAASRRHRHCAGRGVPIVDAAGSVREWIGTITDTDDRRRAERAAHFLADATALLAHSLDVESTLSQVAWLAVPALADICTVHLAEDDHVRMVAGAHRDPARQADLQAPHDRGERCPATEVVATGRTDLSSTPCDACQGAGARAAAAEPWGSRLCVPMSARGKSLGAICFLLLDGSPRRFDPSDVALCEELARRAALAIDNARLYRVAQRAAQAREEFLVIASHELQTPLAPLKLAVQSLLKHARADEPSSARGLAMLGAVERSTDRLALLVDELLDVARLSSARLELTPAPVDLAAVVADVLARSRPALAGAGCEVRLDVEGPTSGRWDPSWLDKALARLVANAAKYGRGSSIDIRVAGDASAVRLSVRDHGFGIPAAEQARIFERFERAVSTRHYGGFGFGLWCVRRIVEAHDGSVRVESAPGEGATFTIELPRRGAAARAA